MAFSVAKDSAGSTTILTNNSTSALFEFKKFISDNANNASWDVVASGDGLSVYDGTADTLTAATSGANGLANNGAWFIIKNSGGSGNSFCFQRGSADNEFKVKYSVSGSWNLAGSSANTTPVSTDEKFVLGDASTFANLFRVSDKALKCHFVCESSTVGSWVIFGNEANQPGISFFHVFDYLEYANSMDTDPYIIIIDGDAGSPATASGTIAALNNLTDKVKGHVRHGESDEIFGSMQAFAPSSDGQSIIGSLQASPYTGKDGTLPVIYGKRQTAGTTSPYGIKGQSSLLRWHLQNRSDYFAFEIKTSPSATSTEDRIVIGNVSLPWDGTSVSV